jgi:hypothetical protein
MDAPDARADQIINLLRETGAKLKETVDVVNGVAVNMEALTVRVDTLTAKVDALVSALLREHPNGHGGSGNAA